MCRWWCVNVMCCSVCHAKRAWGAPSAEPATQNEPEVLQVLRQPRKTRWRPKASLVARLQPTSIWRCSECCACHVKRAKDAPSAAPATQNKAASKSITRRQTPADLYGGAPSAAPATQNEPEMLQVLRLPRKTRRHPKASLVARLPPTSTCFCIVVALVALESSGANPGQNLELSGAKPWVIRGKTLSHPRQNMTASMIYN